ncbi:MAG: S49 family peptidase [Anaerolineaceae bacterium]|nr:S49 family peptidase [Anaerolineaceae bacterium]
MGEENVSHPWGFKGWMLFVLLPLVIGVAVSFLIPQPVVGVIYLNDAIYSYSAQKMISQIIYAREHEEIRAVVLVMNSPGGTVTDTESVYLELARLRETKPVIGVIEGMAASGAYYLSVGTDYLLAKPSSGVGNVGVIGYLPEIPMVFEDIYSTGPYKLWGAPRDTFVREMEMLKEGFIQAVLLGRGDNLNVPEEVILRGELWSGSEALRLGLIDALGSQSEAYDKAADMAKIHHYRVEDLSQFIDNNIPELYTFFHETEQGLLTPYPREAGIYLLYIPPMKVMP